MGNICSGAQASRPKMPKPDTKVFTAMFERHNKWIVYNEATGMGEEQKGDHIDVSNAVAVPVLNEVFVFKKQQIKTFKYTITGTEPPTMTALEELPHYLDEFAICKLSNN